MITTARPPSEPNELRLEAETAADRVTLAKLARAFRAGVDEQTIVKRRGGPSNESRIVDLLSSSADAWTVEQVCGALKLQAGVVRGALHRLCSNQAVRRVKQGQYGRVETK